ncbi:MAG: GreA/GreB family elongation factor [Chloroflexi bacterium]|nr:GreA/GreB family elongation factor [Chloroflexota bacterium]
MAERRIQLTRRGYEKLRRELNILTSEENSKVAEMLAEAREDDQGEEAVFFDAMVSKERLDERVSHLQNVLARAEIIDADADINIVTPGNRVIVYDSGEKEEFALDLLDTEEITHGRRGVSLDSPVGKALLGKRVGDRVKVEVPDGVVTYRVRGIEMIPDGDN